MTPLVERLRALPAPARAALFDQVGRRPGALADVRYDWERVWAREDQIVTPDELEQHAVVVFAGPRGCGKTRAAVQLFLREIAEGRARRPRIVAGTEADIDKTVVHGVSGIMACLPPEERPVWVKAEGGAGVLRCRNGVEVLCFTAKSEEQLVGTASDLDLLDDVAKWGVRAEDVWRHARASCRLGNMNAIVATTRRGTVLLRKMLKPGEVDGVLVRRPDDTRANRNNLAAKFYRQLEAELGGSDFLAQELEDEDVSATSPFAGLEFDAAPIRVLAAPRAEFAEVVVAVDPAEGKGGDHDEWGIGAAGRRGDRHVVALDDASGSYDDAEASDVAIALCATWGASKIVVETNRGPRVQNALRAAYYKRALEAQLAGGRAPPMPEIVGVTARDGKRLRAGPLRALYLQGMLHHVAGLGALEKQQREWAPDGPKRPRQDDRIDWLVHVVHYLASLDSAPSEAGVLGLGARVREAQRAPAPGVVDRARRPVVGLGGRRVL